MSPRRLILLVAACLLSVAATTALPQAPTLAAYLDRPYAFTLPAAIPLERAVADAISLNQANGGATYSLYFGDQAHQPLFAVSIFPDLSQRAPGKELPAGALRAFVKAHRQLLSDPRCNIGTWYDADHKETWLDVSVTLPGRTQAVCLGKRYNQEDVFDLRRMETIEVGGTGAPPRYMLPVEQRLPQLRTAPAPRRRSGLWPQKLAPA